MGMTLDISSDVLAHVRRAATGAAGLEVCGLLFGDDRRIEAAQACANVAEDPRRSFEIDPARLLAAHRAARSGGAKIVGHYHSHPSGSATPSARDAAAAAGDGAIWLIVAGPDVRAWRAVEGGSVHGNFEPVAYRGVSS
jgi:proteasome lid subunit RPN8/RPN11